LSVNVGWPTNAARWLTGGNPNRDDKMQADELRDGHDAVVFSAVRDLVER
jgi:hypothetical protein